MNKSTKMALAIVLMATMIFSSFVGMVAVPGASAARDMPATEAAPSVPAGVSGVNENGDDFVVLIDAVVNGGVNPIIGAAGVPVVITLNSTVMDNQREDDGDDVLWNVSAVIVPTFEWLNPETGEWEPTTDITFSVDAAEAGAWLEDFGPTNALWVNPDDAVTKYVPSYMSQPWDDGVDAYLDADNDGDVEVDYAEDDVEWEARNVTADAKDFAGFEVDIAGDAMAGEYRVTVEVSYRYNTHVDVDPDQDGDDDPSTTDDDATNIGDFTGLNVNMVGDNMWQDEQPLGDFEWYYWVPWDTTADTMLDLTAADAKAIAFGPDGQPGVARETLANDGLDNNNNWKRYGFDGMPGIAGVDDDGNGIIDDATETGGDDHDINGDGLKSADWDGPFADWNGDNDYTYDPEPFIDEGNVSNDVAWRLGLDGGPGVAGFDDDGNAVVDNAGEIGWPGSDDILQSPDDNGNWRANELPLVYGSYTFADDLDRGLVFPANTMYESRDDYEYELNEFIFVDSNGDGDVDGTDHVLFPLWDHVTFTATPASVAYKTPGTAIPDTVHFEDWHNAGVWDDDEGMWIDAATGTAAVYDDGVDTLVYDDATLADTDAGVQFNTGGYVTALYYNSGAGVGFGANDIIWLDTVNATENEYDRGEAFFPWTYHAMTADNPATAFPANSAFYNGETATPAAFDWRFQTSDRIWQNTVGNTVATSPANSPTVPLPQCFFDLMDVQAVDGNGCVDGNDRNVDEVWEVSWLTSDDGTLPADVGFGKTVDYYEPDDGNVWTEGALWNDWEAIRDDGMGDPSAFATTLSNNTWTLTGQSYFDVDGDGQTTWYDANPAVDPFNTSIRYAFQVLWHELYVNSYNERPVGTDYALYTNLPTADQQPAGVHDVLAGNGAWQYSGFEGDTVWALNGASQIFTELENFTFEVDTAADVTVNGMTTMFYAGDVFESYILDADFNEEGEDAVIALDTSGLTGIDLIVEDAYVPDVDAVTLENFYYRVNVDMGTPAGIYEIPYTLTYVNDDGVTVVSTGTVDLIVDFTPVIVVRDWTKPNFDQGDIRETFTVTFENVGNVPLRGINMTLDIGDRDDDLYPTEHQYEQGNGTGAWTTFDLSVRLDAPGQPMDIGDTVTASFPAGILSGIPAGTHMIPFKWTAFYEDDGSTGFPSRFVEVMVRWMPGNADNGLLDGFNDLDLFKVTLEDPMDPLGQHPEGVYELYHTDLSFPPATGYSIYGVRDIYVDTDVNMIEMLEAAVRSGPVFLSESGLAGHQTTDIPVTVRLWNSEMEMDLDNVGDAMSEEWGDFALTDIQATLLKTEDSPFAAVAIADADENATLYWTDFTDLSFEVTLLPDMPEAFYTVPMRVTATNTLTGETVTRFVDVVFDLHYPMIDVALNPASDALIEGGQVNNIDFIVDINNNEGFGFQLNGMGGMGMGQQIDIIVVSDSSGEYNNNGINWEDMDFEIANFENWLYDIEQQLEAQGYDVNVKVYVLWEVNNLKNSCKIAEELDVGYFDNTDDGVDNGFVATLKTMIINDNNQRPKEAWAQAAAYIAQADQEWRPGASKYVIPMGTEMPYDEGRNAPTANDMHARRSLLNMAAAHNVNVIPIWGSYQTLPLQPQNVDVDVTTFMTGAATADMPALGFWDANSADIVASAMVGGDAPVGVQTVTFQYAYANLTVGGTNPLNDPIRPMSQGAGVLPEEIGMLGDVTVNYVVDRNDVQDGTYVVTVTIDGYSVGSGQKISLEKTFRVLYRPAPPNLTIKQLTTTTIVPGQPFNMELTIYNAGTDTAQNVDIYLDGYIAQYNWDILAQFINFMTPWTITMPSNSTFVNNMDIEDNDQFQNQFGDDNDDNYIDYWTDNYNDNWANTNGGWGEDWKQSITMDDLGLEDAEDIYDLYDYHNRSQSSPQARVKHIHLNQVLPGQFVNITFVVNADGKALEGKVYKEYITISHTDSFGVTTVQEIEEITVQTGTGDVIADDDDGFEFNDTLTYVCLGIFAVIVIIIIVALAVTGRGNGGDDDEDFEELIEEEDIEDAPADEPEETKED